MPIVGPLFMKKLEQESLVMHLEINAAALRKLVYRNDKFDHSCETRLAVQELERLVAATKKNLRRDYKEATNGNTLSRNKTEG